MNIIETYDTVILMDGMTVLNLVSKQGNFIFEYDFSLNSYVRIETSDMRAYIEGKMHEQETNNNL